MVREAEVHSHHVYLLLTGAYGHHLRLAGPRSGRELSEGAQSDPHIHGGRHPERQSRGLPGQPEPVAHDAAQLRAESRPAQAAELSASVRGSVTAGAGRACPDCGGRTGSVWESRV